MKIRDFRLLWIGEGISLLGDQSYMIALPWLVLLLSENALAVGTVFAAAGIPRALFMLVGGALTDRFRPRKLMINSNLVHMALTCLLAALERMELWYVLHRFAHICCLVFCFSVLAEQNIRSGYPAHCLTASIRRSRIEVPRVDYEKLSGDRVGESSECIRARVEAARDIQNKRFSRNASSGIVCNADMHVGEIRQFCKLQEEG